MSTPPAPHEQHLFNVLAAFEPVRDIRLQDPTLIDCAAGCGRTVAPEVRVCVGCRNTSQHPALWGKRAARS